MTTIPTTTLANVAVPSIQYHLPMMALLLLPIIMVETSFVRHRLGGGWWRTAGHVMVANAASTVVGIPVAWGLMRLLGELGRAGGLQPGIDTPLGMLGTALLNATTSSSGSRGHVAWLMPTSTIIMLGPYLVASILVERWVLRRRLPDIEPRRIHGAVRLANGVSYSALAVLLYAELWSVAT